MIDTIKMTIFFAVRHQVRQFIWRIMANSSTRILATITISILLFALFFLVYTYNVQLDAYKQSELSRLEALAKTTSLAIDGDSHQLLSENYQTKDDIRDSESNTGYAEINQLLKHIKVDNGLETDIYTMVKSDKGAFEFIVTSSDSPYFRHEWKEFRAENDQQFNEGASFGPYKDEHGSWLSAFAPIKNSAGEVVAVIQADSCFDTFIWHVRRTIGWYLLILVVMFSVMMFFMMRSVSRVLRKENLLHDRIVEQNSVIKKAQDDVVDSIKYAKTIQFATLPQGEEIRETFDKSFVLFKPRDIVSGDFYWVFNKGKRSYFAVADCTGHGVPGAFMSLIGNTTLTNIMNECGDLTPAEILKRLDAKIKSILSTEEASTRDGMDISLLLHDQSTGTIEYAGANRPVIHYSGEKVNLIKGDKQAIGSLDSCSSGFTNHVFKVKKGDRMYMYSDGYPDQFGGQKGKKYYSKRLRSLIQSVQDLDIRDQKHLFNYEFHLWKENHDQVDDILLAGLEVS